MGVCICGGQEFKSRSRHMWHKVANGSPLLQHLVYLSWKDRLKLNKLSRVPALPWRYVASMYPVNSSVVQREHNEILVLIIVDQQWRPLPDIYYWSVLTRIIPKIRLLLWSKTQHYEQSAHKWQRNSVESTGLVIEILRNLDSLPMW